MAPAERITRDDIESKFRELEGEAVETADAARTYVVIAAAAIVITIAAVAFVMGRRKGRKKTTIVEIKRV
jgi:hypothetical protein